MTDPVNLIILGASGDLTHRLLLPGLGTLMQAHHSIEINLIGAAMEDWTQEHWREVAATAIAESGCPRARMQAMLDTTSYVQVDAGSPTDLAGLMAGLTGRIVLYLALPPAVSMMTCEALCQITLPPDFYLAIEKPFGTDAESAKQFNELLAKLVDEDHVFRVDHYLGKATVLNLLGLRFTNRIWEPVWNADNIESIQIIADETLALEGRAGYYDKAGALKDMIQSHLLLVMAMLCMEEIASIDANELRDLQAHLLRATTLWHDDPIGSSRRARYTAGTINGVAIPSYVDEPGVEPDRDTETLAEITVEVRNARWQGVPITLRSGKALGDNMRAIVVVFKPVAHVPVGFLGAAPQNVVVIGFSPEFLQVKISTNGAGESLDLEETILAAELGESPIRPYGEILDRILHGDPVLSVRGDIAEECWRILTPVLDAWADNQVPLDSYPAGSAGPSNWR